jgi:hypothetical protein
MRQDVVILLGLSPPHCALVNVTLVSLDVSEWAELRTIGS